MPTARFQANFNKSSIDANTGVITGVKIMELGKLASFAGPDGKPKQVKIVDAHIKRLMQFAGNRAVVAHLTHEWFDAQGKENADSTEMAARIGAFKQFRKDGNGDLIADLHLKPGSEREQILWGAENNPEDNMVSVVFSYDKNDPQCLPLDFTAADLVPSGAATTALFSETTNNMPITIDDLKTLLEDPKAKEMLRGCIDGHDDAEDAEMEDSAAAEMEKDADVTDDDKKKEDEQKPALMRAQLRCNRAHARRSKSLVLDEKALLEKAKVQSEAAATALLGKGGFIKQGGEGDPNQTATARFNAAVKELTDRGVKSGIANQTIMREKPELLKAMQIEQGVFKK